MRSVPINAANAVAVNTAPESIPAADRILGFTARIYAIVMNVVIPARISVFTSVLFSESLNIFSNISPSPFPLGPFYNLGYCNIFLHTLHPKGLSPFMITGNKPF